MEKTFRLLISLSLVSFNISLTAASLKETRPNVIVVLTDDQATAICRAMAIRC
jgi:hypothetical protein